MSRRKQSNPARHLDGENDTRYKVIYYPWTSDDSTGPALFTSDPPAPSLDPEAVVQDDDAKDQRHHPPHVDNEEYLEPVICVNCQQEFCSQWDLMAHEKACCALSMDNAQYDDQLPDKPEDGEPIPHSGPGSELEGEEEVEVEDPGASQEELLSRVDGEMMGEEGEEEMEEEFESGAQSDPDDYMAVPLTMAGAGVVPGRDGYPFITPEQGKSEENKENNSSLSNQTDEGEDVEPSNGEVVENFDPSMTSLSSMFPGNNVTLEPMSATKAAVAQFPLAQSQIPDDPSMSTQKAIEEWKRKDMVNQQIIHRMQMALMNKGISMTDLMGEIFGISNPNFGLPPTALDMASAVMMGSHSMAGYLSSQAEKLQKEEAKALKEEEDVKDIPKDFSKDIEQAIKQVDREFSQDPSKLKSDSSADSKPAPSATTSSSSSTLSSSSSATSSFLSSMTASSPAPVTSSLSALSSMTNGSGLGLGGSGPLGGPIKSDGERSGSTQQYSSSSLSALQRETDALKTSLLPRLQLPMTPEAYRGYCQRGTVLERSQYACDDPFFKHKCRFCHKVFGSDSALQIHVRSHTGERPFKCNICGNRFSTKGNLKVHFERHKAKYPHIKMNPNPVPESFDRLPPVVPPPMSSSTPIPSSLPLPSGMMPGEPHSPAGPRMMFPPGSAGPAGFFTPGPVGGFLPHPFARLPGHPPPPPPHHHPMMSGPPRPLLSPVHPKSEPLPPASPSSKPSPRDTPKSGGDVARSPSRAEADFSAPSSHGSSEKPGGGSRASSPPPPSSSVPPSSVIRSEPGVPVSSMAALSSAPMPPLIHTHPPPMPPHTLSLPSPHPLARSTPGPIFSNHSLPATPTSFPLPSPLSASFPALMRGHGNPFLAPSPLTVGADGMFRNTILPTKTIDPSENLEQYMEIQKSETDKLQQLVNNIPDKVREPNQCLVCHRVLSCKSALQMHYRIHTGERPFKCKICNRKFTTKGNLKTHMGVHRTKSPLRVVHSCPVCHKHFTNILVLQTHIRQQHGGLPATPLPHMPFFSHVPDWAGKAHHLPPGPMMHIPPPPPPHAKPYEPFDLSRHQEPKELDLSNKRNNALAFGAEGDAKNLGSPYAGSQDISPIPEEDEDEAMDEEARKEAEAMREEELMMEEEEAYNLSRDGGSSGPASQGPRSTMSDNGDSDRPDSNTSGVYGGYDLNQPLPPSADSMDTFLNPSQPPPRGVNPSLAALEDSVKNLSASESQSGFERLRNSLGFGASPFLMDKALSPGVLMPHPSGGSSDKSPASPRSQGSNPSPVNQTPTSSSTNGNSNSNNNNNNNNNNPYNNNNNKSFPDGNSVKKEPSSSSSSSTAPSSPRDGPLSISRRPKHVCDTCMKPFSSASALQIHTRTHTGDKPFKCTVCNKAFTTRGNLKVHMGTHMYNNAPSRRGRRMSIDNPLFFAGNPYLAAAAGFPPVPPRPPHPHHDPYFPYPLMNGMAASRPNEISVIQNVNGGMGHHLPMYPTFPGHPFSGLAASASEEAAKHAADLRLARSHSDSGVRERDGERDRRIESEREPSPSPKRVREHSPSPFRSASLPNGSVDAAGTMTPSGELDLSMKSSSTPRSSPPESSLRLAPPASPPRMPSYPTSPAVMTSTSPAKSQASSDRAASPAQVNVQENSQENLMSSPLPVCVWNTLSCHRCGQTFPSRPALEQHIQTHHMNGDSHPGGQPITA